MAKKRSTTDPRQPQFWSDEEAMLWDALAPTLLKVMFTGMRAGAEALPSGLQVLVNWDWVNERAVAWMRDYRFEWVRGINDTTRKQTQDAIEDWIRSGEALPTLEAKLVPIYGEVRASRIATTEVTRIYEGGHQAAWESTGYVDEFVYLTSVDDKVCPLCGPLDGQVFPMNDRAHTPPIHVGCRCRRQPRVSEKLFREQIQGILEGA